MCVCAHIVSSRTQVKQVMFTLIETNVINTFRSLSDYTVSISQQTFHRSFPLTVHVYQQSFKCKFKSVQSAFIHKEFCMQKNKVKAFICCCFSILPEKN